MGSYFSILRLKTQSPPRETNRINVVYMYSIKYITLDETNQPSLISTILVIVNSNSWGYILLFHDENDEC